jgi:hypothetical protein
VCIILSAFNNSLLNEGLKQGMLMITMRDRAQALEMKYTQEQTWLFRAEARRNKLIGLWAAETMGAQDPLGYATNLAEWGVEHPTDVQLIDRLRQDFTAANVVLNEDEITSRMHALLIEILEEMRT